MKKEEKRKKVLLIGNGPFRTKGNDWTNIVNLYVNGNNKKKIDLKNEPLKTLLADFNEKKHIERIKTAFNDYKYHDDNKLKEFLESFDVILTTNFTYNIECLLLDKKDVKVFEKPFDKNNKKIINKYAKPKPKKLNKESGYLIHTYNDVNNHEIWHIHGELRNPRSVVLGLPSYAQLISRITKYCNSKKPKDKIKKISYNSWIDYFLYCDLTVVGLGFSYDDIDLWWLLNRRKNLNNKGNVTYYDKETNDEKKKLFKMLNVKVLNINAKSYNEFYSLVYKKAKHSEEVIK